MLEQRERGEEPDFDGFMERYGDFFPGNPQTLDELLEQMAQSMAQMQQLLNSMTPEQRAQLQQLAESLLEDMDLRWQIDQLSRNLQQAFPNLPWERSMRSAATTRCRWARCRACSTRSATSTTSSTCCARPRSPASSPRSTSTGPASCSATTPPGRSSGSRELAQMLEDAGLIEQREGRLELTPRGVRAIGQKALGDLFRKLMKDRAGRHELERAGVGHERAYEHKPYEFGDPFHLERAADGEERDLASGRGHAGAAHARRLRGRAHRDAHARRPPCCCSTCRCRCRCATTSCPRRRSRWRCTRSSPASSRATTSGSSASGASRARCSPSCCPR